MLAQPIIPQTRLALRGATAASILASAGDTVAIPMVHDWGPMATDLPKLVAIPDYATWVATYGDSLTTDGGIAAAQAFVGQNISGSSGAGAIIPVRIGTGATAAAVTLQAGGTPAMTLTAKYRGTRGNDFSIQVDDDPTNTANARARVRYKGGPQQTYTYVKTDIASLVTAINARVDSSVLATQLATGTALTATANSPLVGGANGTVTVTDYASATTMMEFGRFSIMAPANLTDTAVMVSLLSWIQLQDTANRPVIMVVGGAAGESASQAITRSQAIADPHVVNFGIGTYLDDTTAQNLSTAQLAPRIAGILAALGESASLTAAEIGGLHPVGLTGPDVATGASAMKNGVTCLIRTDSDEADVRIVRGVTTFTSSTDPDRPLEIFSEPRFIRIIDNFVRDMRQWGDKNIIGKTTNTQDTRDAVKAEVTRRIGILVRNQLVLTKATGAKADPYCNVPDSVTDTIRFFFGWQFARTSNYLLGDGVVS